MLYGMRHQTLIVQSALQMLADCPRGVPREAKMCLRLIAETDARSVGDIAILLVFLLNDF